MNLLKCSRRGFWAGKEDTQSCEAVDGIRDAPIARRGACFIQPGEGRLPLVEILKDSWRMLGKAGVESDCRKLGLATSAWRKTEVLRQE